MADSDTGDIEKLHQRLLTIQAQYGDKGVEEYLAGRQEARAAKMAERQKLDEGRLQMARGTVPLGPPVDSGVTVDGKMQTYPVGSHLEQAEADKRRYLGDFEGKGLFDKAKEVVSGRYGHAVSDAFDEATYADTKDHAWVPEEKRRIGRAAAALGIGAVTGGVAGTLASGLVSQGTSGALSAIDAAIADSLAGGAVGSGAATAYEGGSPGDIGRSAYNGARTSVALGVPLAMAGAGVGTLGRRSSDSIRDTNKITGEIIEARDRTAPIRESAEYKAARQGVRGTGDMAVKKGVDIAEAHGQEAAAMGRDLNAEEAAIPGNADSVRIAPAFRKLNQTIERYDSSRLPKDPAFEARIREAQRNLSGPVRNDLEYIENVKARDLAEGRVPWPQDDAPPEIQSRGDGITPTSGRVVPYADLEQVIGQRVVRPGDELRPERVIGTQPGPPGVSKPFASPRDIASQKRSFYEQAGYGMAPDAQNVSARKAGHVLKETLYDLPDGVGDAYKAAGGKYEARASALEKANSLLINDNDAHAIWSVDKDTGALRPDQMKMAESIGETLRQALSESVAGGKKIERLERIKALGGIYKDAVEHLEARAAEDLSKITPTPDAITKPLSSGSVLMHNKNAILVKLVEPVAKTLAEALATGNAGSSLQMGVRGGVIAAGRMAEKQREEERAAKLRAAQP